MTEASALLADLAPSVIRCDCHGIFWGRSQGKWCGQQDGAPRFFTSLDELALVHRDLVPLAVGDMEPLWRAYTEAAGKVREYESAISWGTHCLHCSVVLDSMYRETVRAEVAEEALVEVRRLADGWLTGGPDGAARLVLNGAARDILRVIDDRPADEVRKDLDGA